MKKIPIIIDCDTGIDDALAIATACYTKNLDLVMLSSTFGNTSVENVSKNNLNILNAINKPEIPVTIGSKKSLSSHEIIASAHGESGLGNYVFDENNLLQLAGDSIPAIHNAINSHISPITLVVTGPLTTIAEFLTAHPEDKAKIERIVICSGLIEERDPDTPPYLSFNIAKDAIAFEQVFNSGVKTVIVPSNLGHDCYLNWQEVFKTKNTNQTGAMFEKIFRSYHDRHIKNGIATHDMCAIFALSNPKLFVWEPAEVNLKYYNNIGYIDFDFNSSTPNTTVATACDIKKLKKLYFKILKKMP